jgi:hypothetical protein
MLGEGGTALSKLEEAIREFQACGDRRVDLKGLREGIDALKVQLASDEELAREVHPRRPAESKGRLRSS